MTEFPDARRVTLELADLRRLTILERARACATVGVDESSIKPLLEAVSSRQGSADDTARGIELLYAIAHQLYRRIDPTCSWEDAQAFDLVLDLGAPADPVAEAEALAGVEAAIATGLPPAEAGELTLAQIDAYRTVRERAARDAKGRRRARVHR